MDDKTKQKLVNTIARTQTFSGPIVNPLQNQATTYAAPQTPSNKLGVAGQAVDFASRFARQVGSMAVSGGKFVATAPIKLAEKTWDGFSSTADSLLNVGAKLATGKSYYDRQMDNVAERSRVNQNQIDDAVNAYRAGKITKSRYNALIKDASEEAGAISQEQTDITAHIGDATKRAAAVAETLSLPLAVSKLRSIEAAPGVFTAGNVTIKGIDGAAATELATRLTRTTKSLENIITKVPSVGALLERRAGEAALDTTIQQAIRQGTKDVVVGFLLKKPFIVDSNIDDIAKIAEDVGRGHFGPALARTAWVATQALRGGPLGAAFEGLSKLGGGARSLAFGRGSFIDQLSRNIGQGDASGIYKYLTELNAKDPTKFGRTEEALKALQEMNLRKASEDVNLAVQFVRDHYISRGIDLKDLGPEALVEDMLKYYDNFKKVADYARSGLIDGLARHEWQKVAVGTFDTSAKASLVKMLRDIGDDKVSQLELVNKMANEGVQWTQNRLIFNKIRRLVTETEDINVMAKEIMGISTASELKGVPKKLADELAKDGYFVIRPQKNLSQFVEGSESRKLVSAFAPKDDPLFEQSLKPFPVAQGIGGALRQAGLSTEDTNAAVYYRLTDNIAQNLQDLKLSRKLNIVGDGTTDAQVIMRRLQDFSETKRSVTDIRQLTLKELEKALDINTNDAKQVRKAIMQAYLDVPLQLRGLGDRLQDVNLRYNPLAAPYSRVQSAARYTYNPFFRWQEITETELLSQMTAGGKKPHYLGLGKLNSLIFRTSAQELDNTVSKLDDARIFSTGFSGEGAVDQVFGRVTANITKTQKRSIAGLVQKMAQRKGQSVDDLLANNFDEVADAARVIVQYPKHGSLNSPLARTLNIAFFPVRYNIKVTGLAAQQIAKLSPAVQLATINSIFDMAGWLNSDEGIQWKSTHKEAIQLFAWLTPSGNITSVMKLLNGNVHSVSDIGQLGGLPFGVISQMLESQGLIKLQTPYVDPATGDVFPTYIPKTLKARAGVALTDLLGSLFTYPGRTIGLPGKGETLRNVAEGITGQKASDFNKLDNTVNLTPQQQRQSQVIKKFRQGQGTSVQTKTNGEVNFLPGQFNGYTVPMNLPNIERKTNIYEPSKADLTAMKRAGRSSGSAKRRTARNIQKR